MAVTERGEDLVCSSRSPGLGLVREGGRGPVCRPCFTRWDIVAGFEAGGAGVGFVFFREASMC